MGVLTVRALLFRVFIRALIFGHSSHVACSWLVFVASVRAGSRLCFGAQELGIHIGDHRY